GTDRAHPEHPVGELALSDLEAAYPKVAQTVPERRAEKHDEHEVLRGEHPERRERGVVEERRRDERAGDPVHEEREHSPPKPCARSRSLCREADAARPDPWSLEP